MDNGCPHPNPLPEGKGTNVIRYPLIRSRIR